MWPSIGIQSVTTVEWDQIMHETSPLNHFFDPSLPDWADFTIRSIIAALIYSTRWKVAHTFEGSPLLPRLLEIKQTLHTDHATALTMIQDLISDYNLHIHSET